MIVLVLCAQEFTLPEGKIGPAGCEGFSRGPDETLIVEVTGQIFDILKSAKTIAVVGLSDKPDRPSYGVSSYMQSKGYRIIPINPRCRTVLGEKAYSSLLDIPKEIKVDIVDIFRRPDQVLPVVEEAVELRPELIWLQLGISNDLAQQTATEAGIPFIMDACIAVAHQQLLRKSPTR